MTSIQLRPHQEYVLKEIEKKLGESTTFFINMPTGGGKTLLSLLVFKLLKEKMVRQVLVAVRTKNEFTPYFRDNKKFNLGFKCTGLIGKNEACGDIVIKTVIEELENVNPCNQCPLRTKTLNPDEVFKIVDENVSLVPILNMNNICPYYTLQMSSIFADLTCLTYPYLFTGRIKIIIERKRIADMIVDPSELLLIVDEAHNIDNVVELYERKLNVNYLKKVEDAVSKLEIDASLTEIRSLRLFVERVKRKELIHIKKEEIPRIDLSPYIEWLKMPRTFNEIKEVKGLIKAVSSLVKFYEFLDHSEFEPFTYEHGICLKLLFPKFLIEGYLDIFPTKILMSGTLPPQDYIQQLWGLNGEYIDVTKKFKLYNENKEAYIVSTVTSKYQYRDKNIPKYAQILTKLCRELDTVKLIVFPSYQFMKQILNLIPSDIIAKSIIEESFTKIEQVYEEVKTGLKKNICCVAGGKLTEGIELVDENGKSLIGDVIMVGVPYPEVSDYMKKKAEKIKQALGGNIDLFRLMYHIPAVLLTKQAIGRAVRSEKDHARIWLLDYRFKYMVDELDVNLSVLRLVK